MEKVIDRKEYRRNNIENQIDEDEKIEWIRNKLKKFLIQVLSASLLFLMVAFLRLYNCNEMLMEINNALDSEINLVSLQKSGQIIFSEATKYYTKLNVFVENFMNNEYIKDLQLKEDKFVQESGNQENMLVINLISGDISNASAEFASGEFFESAVEGINQMSEDAKHLKENYKFTVPVIGTITSRFGVRNSENPKVSAYHSGLDIAANIGTQILSTLDGEVVEATTDTYYGKYLKIKKDDIVVTYAHCSKLLVKVGQKVKRGALIAYVGNTGNSTGPHLHLEIKYNGRLVNPEDVMDIE